MEIKFNTVTGKLLDLNKLNAREIDIEDIATALSFQCRYNGMVKHFYSVAQHSVILARVIMSLRPSSDNLIKHVLLHDAAEAYIGDMPRNLKEQLPEFKKIERKIEKVIHKAFGLKLLSRQDKEFLSKLDKDICGQEISILQTIIDPDLLSWSVQSKFNFPLALKNAAFKQMTPSRAKKEFMFIFEEIFCK